MALPAKIGDNNTLQKLLELAKPQLAKAAATHLKPDRLIKIACAAASREPKLMECTPQSFLQALIKGAELGLEPGSAIGSAYLVPFWNSTIKKYECILIIGYRGLIDLARRSGSITSIEAHIIHENDKFRICFGITPVLEHEPCLEGEPGRMKAAYAVARFVDGISYQTEVMTRTQIEAIKDRAKAKSGPWVTDFDEMARKTVVKRLCKYLPLSTEMVDAIDHDNRMELGEDTLDLTTIDEHGNVVDKPQTEPETRTSQVREAIKQKAATQPQTEAPAPETQPSQPALPESTRDEELSALDAQLFAEQQTPEREPVPAQATQQTRPAAGRKMRTW